MQRETQRRGRYACRAAAAATALALVCLPAGAQDAPDI